MEPTEVIGQTKSSLIGGFPTPSVNMTDGLIANSFAESETAAASLDSPYGTTFGHAVAYNSSDSITTHWSSLNGGSTCTGYSAAAISYDVSLTSTSFTGTVHNGIHFAPPPNMAILYGDPAITVDVTTQPASVPAWTVYVSSLAISNDFWGSFHPVAGCVTTSAFVTEPPQFDKVCVMAVSIPKNGSPATVLPNTWCIGDAGTTYDGTALTNFNGDVFVASWATPPEGSSHDQISVWANATPLVQANSTELETPFNVPIGGHPKFEWNEYNFPTIIAPDIFNTSFRVASYNGRSLAQTFQVPIVGFTDGKHVNVGGKSIRSDGSYTAVGYGVPFVTRNMWIFYTRTDSSVMRVQGVECSFDDRENSFCRILPQSLTPSNKNAFLPAAAMIPATANSPNKVWLSYWSNTPGSSTVQLIDAKVSASGNQGDTQDTGALTPWNVIGASEGVCPNGDYWGDYDSLIVGNWNSTGPSLLRYLTDSTDGTCTASGLPQHVSVAFGDGAL